MKRNILTKLIAAAVLVLAPAYPTALRASDHADSPTVAGDQAADLADLYAFLDPGDSTKLVLITTVRGFIVPGEAGNFGVFDPAVRFRFQIENTGPVDSKGKPIPAPMPTDVDFDPTPDAFIDVTFSPKTSSAPQVATVQFTGSAFAGIPKGKYVANATAASPASGVPVDYFPANPQSLKLAPKKPTDQPGAAIPVEFFAGVTDDPFFFDIPGFIKFRDTAIDNLAHVPANFSDRSAALVAAATTPGALTRARDTFAGYNILTVALRVPIAQLKNKSVKVTNATKFGINVLAQRQTEHTVKGAKLHVGAYATVDRQGVPGVNALLNPVDKKNAYNGATTIDDSKLKAASGILATLNALQVPGGGATLSGTQLFLAKLVVLDGDFLRIDTSAATAFPNGRKPVDDVVDTLLTVIGALGNPAGSTPVGDSVNTNDVAFSANFPYIGLPQLPRVNGVNDDGTRN